MTNAVLCIVAANFSNFLIISTLVIVLRKFMNLVNKL